MNFEMGAPVIADGKSGVYVEPRGSKHSILVIDEADEPALRRVSNVTLANAIIPNYDRLINGLKIIQAVRRQTQ